MDIAGLKETMQEYEVHEQSHDTIILVYPSFHY